MTAPRRPDRRTSLQPDLLVVARDHLVDGHYVQVATAAGDEVARLARPSPVEVIPSKLI